MKNSLKFKKETVRVLVDDDLGKVAGGMMIPLSTVGCALIGTMMGRGRKTAPWGW